MPPPLEAILVTPNARPPSSESLLMFRMPLSDAESAPSRRSGREVRAVDGPVARQAAPRRSLAQVREEWQETSAACLRKTIELRRAQASLARAESAVIQREAARARTMTDQETLVTILGGAILAAPGTLFSLRLTAPDDPLTSTAADRAIAATILTGLSAWNGYRFRHRLAASWHGFVAGTPEYRAGLRGRVDQLAADLRRLEAAEYRQEVDIVATVVDDATKLRQDVSGLIAGYAVEPSAREDDSARIEVVVEDTPPAAAEH